MDTKKAIKSQFHAGLKMLKEAIEKCPDSLWKHEKTKNKYWHIAHHALFYTHFYLFPDRDEFIPWKEELLDFTDLDEYLEVIELPAQLSQQDALAYLEHIHKEVDRLVDEVDLDAPSGFSWLSFNKLETHLYNLRHLMQHVGELGDQLGYFAGVDMEWVSKG